MSFLWTLGSFLIVIAVLVFVHEYGHFWAARKCGIKVERFSIGFGKVLWRKTDKTGTEFVLSLIPLGGYVKMLDERNATVPEALKPYAFTQKTVAQRAFVIAAGPLANFLFAIFAYVIVFSVGIPTVKPVIENVRPNSIAAAAQMPAYSEIIAVDGAQVSDWETINMLFMAKVGHSQLTLTVSPTNGDRPQQKILDIRNWRIDPEKESAVTSLGFLPVRTKVEMILSKVAEDSPAQRAGLHVGDKIYAGEQLMDWSLFVQKVDQGRSFEVIVERQGRRFPVMLQPEQENGRFKVGVSPQIHPIPEEYRTELKYDILDALQKSLEKTAQLSMLTIKMIGKLLTGDISVSNLGGPISIAKGAGVSSDIGLVYYLSFMALISVNLGIMNLFPLPVLDGGHLVFLAAEALRGKPLSEKVQQISYRIGAALLFTLMAFAIVNDFLRL